jgi:hypothetical protein
MTTVINGSSPSITFSDSTTQSTAGLPLTGGTLTGAVTIPTLNAPSGVLATQNGMTGIAKAWVNFNATGTSIYSAFNVSSVTYNAAGNFTVNFTTAIGNTNYAYTIAVSSDGSVSMSYLNGSKTATILSTSLNVATAYYTGGGAFAASNPTSVAVSIFSS